MKRLFTNKTLGPRVRLAGQVGQHSQRLLPNRYLIDQAANCCWYFYQIDSRCAGSALWSANRKHFIAMHEHERNIRSGKRLLHESIHDVLHLHGTFSEISARGNVVNKFWLRWTCPPRKPVGSLFLDFVWSFDNYYVPAVGMVLTRFNSIWLTAATGSQCFAMKTHRTQLEQIFAVRILDVAWRSKLMRVSVSLMPLHHQ